MSGWLLLLVVAWQCLVSRGERCLRYDGVSPHTGRCFVFTSVSTNSIDSARSRCSVLGGRLVTVHSAFDQAFLNALAKKASYCKFYSCGFYLGLTRERNASCDDWRWADGISSAYTNWQAGQPICNGIFAYMNTTSGHWISQADNRRGHQIACEFDSDGSGNQTCSGTYVYEAASGKCVYFVREGVDQILCETFGCADASVNDAVEQTLFANHIKRTAGVDSWRIGLYDLSDSGDWKWADRSNSTYRNWDQGFPVDRVGRQCTQMQTANGKWMNTACAQDESIGRVCEFLPQNGIP